MYSLRCSLAAAVVMLAITPCSLYSAVLDLSNCPSRLPFEFHLESNLNGRDGILQGHIRSNFAWRDVTGDGVDEHFRINGHGLISASPGGNAKISNWQLNLPVEFAWNDPCGVVEGFLDVDSDGIQELIISASTLRNDAWRIWGIDPLAGEVKCTVELAGGPDLHPDGKWDGQFRVCGVADVPTSGGPRRAFIVLSSVKFDLEPRGAIALDCQTGHVYWRYLVGPDPKIGDGLFVDLDGDDRDEFLFQGVAVNNIKNDRQYNGLGDDQAMVFALNLDGILLWSHRIFQGTGGALIDKIDNALQGNPIIVVASQKQDGIGGNVIRLLHGATGEILSEAPMPGSATGISIVEGSDGADIWWSGAGQLLKASSRGGVLGNPELIARTEGELRVQWTEDLLAPAGGEMLVADGRGDVYAFSGDGELLAHYTHEYGTGPAAAGIGIIRPHPGEKRVLLYNRISDPYQILRLDPTQASAAPVLWAAGLGIAAAGTTAVYWRNRSRKRSALISRRDLRLQVLTQLELSGHGAIGGLQILRRLTWLIGGCAAKGEVSRDITSRLMNLERECRERAIPDLRGILDKARAAELDDRTRLNAEEALDLIERNLRILAAGEFAGDQLLELEGEMRAAGEDAERALQKLRSEAAADFHVDLGRMVGRVLEAFTEEIAARGVTVRVPDSTDLPPVLRVDDDGLAFALDNLVGNALRAMEGKTGATLTIAWEEVDGIGRCMVCDTGCGIAPEDWERIMQPGYSTRKGGGLGLSRSREMLRHYGGQLAVKHSTVGAGTTMMLSLPLSTGSVLEDWSRNEPS